VREAERKNHMWGEVDGVNEEAGSRDTVKHIKTERSVIHREDDIGRRGRVTRYGL